MVRTKDKSGKGALIIQGTSVSAHPIINLRSYHKENMSTHLILLIVEGVEYKLTLDQLMTLGNKATAFANAIKKYHSELEPLMVD